MFGYYVVIYFKCVHYQKIHAHLIKRASIENNCNHCVVYQVLRVVNSCSTVESLNLSHIQPSSKHNKYTKGYPTPLGHF